MTTILSIQSPVASATSGTAQRSSRCSDWVEVWPVHTVNFSNHTGYGAWRGPLLAADDVREVITGIEERDAMPEIDAVLSGYQGGEAIGDVILDAVARVKQANRAAIYACDPVMGNAMSGCFVHPAIPVLLRERVVPQADLITPNQFELGFLTETQPESLEDTLASVERAREMGPSTVLVTSVLRPDRPEGTIEMLAVHGDGAWIVQTPQLPMKANGSGDVTAALFTAHLLETGRGRVLVAPSSVFDLLHRTLDSGRRELQLVQSQERSPTRGCSSSRAAQLRAAGAVSRPPWSRHIGPDSARKPTAPASDMTRSSRWMTSRS